MEALIAILLVCATSFVAGYASNAAILGLFEEKGDEKHV
jgi:hypothetical protein